MTGFKNFILRGNLVELAVALIMALAFAAVVTAFTAWLTGLMPGSSVDELLQRQPSGLSARFLNAVIVVRDPGGGRLLLHRDALHQGEGALLPEPGAGHAGGRRAARGDPRPARRPAGARPRPTPPARRAAEPGRVSAAVVRRHLGAAARRRPGPRRPSRAGPGSRSSAGRLRQHVAEDLGQAAPALPVGSCARASAGAGVAHAQSPRPPGPRVVGLVGRRGGELGDGEADGDRSRLAGARRRRRGPARCRR